VADRVHQRVLHRAQHALGLLLLGEPERRVEAGNHPVELLEHLVRVVERTIGQDVALGAREHGDPEVRQRADLLQAPQQGVGLHVVSEAVGGGVVGDRHVVVAELARGACHLLHARVAV
jgi:hypothetical protein